MKDPKQFRERFKKWKEGTPIEEIYDNGRPTYFESVELLASPMAKNWTNIKEEFKPSAKYVGTAYSNGKDQDKKNSNPYTVEAIVNAIYASNPREEFLGEPSHHYDFTQSEEWANAHGYYPDARGHRDDRVKKIAHPSHPSRGIWNKDQFKLTDFGIKNPNYTLFGLNDGGQDPQAVLTYKGGIVLPEITITPKENYIFNPYDNIILHNKYSGGKDDRTYIGGSNQELVVTPGKSWVNPYTGEYTRATESYAQPIASKDPYVDYQFYSPTGNSIVQTINSTPRWQQYWADREGARVNNAMHQASPKVLDLLTAVDAVATGPEMLEGLYGLYNIGKSGLKNGIKGIYNTIKSSQRIIKTELPSIPSEYSASSNYIDKYRLKNLNISPQKLKEIIETPKSIDINKYKYSDLIDKLYQQNNIIIKEDPIDAFYKSLDMDKRFKFIPSSKFVDYDISKMSDVDIERIFGPQGNSVKHMLDIANAHNFEGRYKKLAEDAIKSLEKLFPISKTDPDVALGLERSRRLYSIPEYRQRFDRFGTLGDTFIEDALDRLDNVRLQGVNGNLGHNVSDKVQAAGLTRIENGPNSRRPLIIVKNTDSSNALQSIMQHEGGHASHGSHILEPAWMKRHNELIKPKLKKRYQNTDNPIVLYQDKMDEIVTRSKTAVEYADRIRKPGESLDEALDRIHEIADKQPQKVPSDVNDLVWYFDKGTLLNFWKNFVGGFIPLGLGLGTATLPKKREYARGKDSGIYIKPSKRGTFTAAAKKRGMSVQSFASKVLNNPSNYSKAMRKKAQFAKNASKFKH